MPRELFSLLFFFFLFFRRQRRDNEANIGAAAILFDPTRHPRGTGGQDGFFSHLISYSSSTGTLFFSSCSASRGQHLNNNSFEFDGGAGAVHYPFADFQLINSTINVSNSGQQRLYCWLDACSSRFNGGSWFETGGSSWIRTWWVDFNGQSWVLTGNWKRDGPRR